MDKIKIAIITPCYYPSYILNRLLNSLKIQTKKEQLVIYLVNDCSPNTKNEYQDIIQKYQSFLNIIYLKTKKNSGPGIARQLALDQVQEDYIFFIDDDDYLYNDYIIENLLFYLKQDYKVINSILLERFEQNNKIMHEQTISNIINWPGSIYKTSFIKKYNIHFHQENSFFGEHGDFIKQVGYFLSLEKEKQYIRVPSIFYIVHHSNQLDTITWNKEYLIEDLEIISDAIQIEFFQKHKNNLSNFDKKYVLRLLSKYYTASHLILYKIEKYGFNKRLTKDKIPILYNRWLYIIELINNNQIFLNNNNKDFDYLKEQFKKDPQAYMTWKEFCKSFTERFDKIINKNE